MYLTHAQAEQIFGNHAHFQSRSDFFAEVEISLTKLRNGYNVEITNVCCTW